MAPLLHRAAIISVNVYLLIAYFLVNISVKNCQNRFMFVRVIARQSSDFFVHSVYFPPIPVPAYYFSSYCYSIHAT